MTTKGKTLLQSLERIRRQAEVWGSVTSSDQRSQGRRIGTASPVPPISSPQFLPPFWKEAQTTFWEILVLCFWETFAGKGRAGWLRLLSSPELCIPQGSLYFGQFLQDPGHSFTGSHFPQFLGIPFGPVDMLNTLLWAFLRLPRWYQNFLFN